MSAPELYIPKDDRERKLDQLEGALSAEAGFLAACKHWHDDPPKRERIENRRKDLRDTCAEYVAQFGQAHVEYEQARKIERDQILAEIVEACVWTKHGPRGVESASIDAFELAELLNKLIAR